MKTEQHTIYRCEHCRKTYFKKHFCIQHEKDCVKNPVNFRACFGCKYLTKGKSDAIIVTGFLKEIIQEVEVLSCAERGCFLYPPKIENHSNPYYLKDGDNYPMPITCDLFKPEELG